MISKQELWKKHAKEVEAIISVASCTSTEEYNTRAKVVAFELTPEQFKHLPNFFHTNKPDIPEDQQDRFEGFSGGIDWMVAVQRAIFAIYYYRPDVSLPIVKEIAYGIYDWTQVTALETLCKFARSGIETEQIVEEIADKMSQFRYEALMPTIDYVSNVGLAHPTLIQRFENFATEFIDGDPSDAIHIINGLFRIDKEGSKKYEPFLRDTMRGKGLENRAPILDGAVVDENGEVVSWGHSGPPPAQVHQIRSAVILWHLFPDDSEVIDKLKDWYINHPDQDIRKSIENLLNST